MSDLRGSDGTPREEGETKMTRQTSIDVYHRIKEEGLLGKLQLSVLEIVYRHGPISQGEVCREFFNRNEERSITPRFAELVRRNAITEVGQRPCRTTGNLVYVYEWSKKLPDPIVKSSKVKCSHCKGRGYAAEQMSFL
jgi:hypothetical protein